MAPSLQAGRTEDGKTVVIHSVFPMDGGESDHMGWKYTPLAANKSVISYVHILPRTSAHKISTILAA